jgi:hypothetical protein
MNPIYVDTARLLTQIAPLVMVDDTFALRKWAVTIFDDPARSIHGRFGCVHAISDARADAAMKKVFEWSPLIVFTDRR